MKNNKILFLVTSLNSGGIENFLLRYIQYAHNTKSIVLCKGGVGGELEDKYIDLIGKDSILKFNIGYFNLCSWIKLIRIFRKNNINTVCDFTGNFAGIPMMCASIAGVNKRITFYRGSTNHFKESTFKIFYNFLANKLVRLFSTNILSNSKVALDFFHPKWILNTEKYCVIYNGIDSDFESHDVSRESVLDSLGIPHSAFVVGHTGRYNIAKNHDTIIKVAIELCQKNKSIYFILAGKNTDIELCDIIKNKGLEEQIKLLGYRTDVKELLKGMDLFYFPSITEGQPNSLIEAMISGLPIVSSNIAPIIESVPNEFKCKLLNPLDVSMAVNRIEHYYLNRESMSEAILKKWAIKYYASNYWFDKFRNVLE